MAKTLKSSTDIARSPRDVFTYVTDAPHLPEWQPSVDEAAAEPPGDPGVGMPGWEVRQVPGGPRKIRWEVTDYEPDRRYGVQGVEGRSEERRVGKERRFRWSAYY